MDQETAKILTEHAKECGGHEVTFHDEYEMGIAGPWCRVYRCQKCGHVTREVLRDANGNEKRKSA
jgi:DNA-directed RNA polymerase subunit M/transcription elongation factor TFIIS